MPDSSTCRGLFTTRGVACGMKDQPKRSMSTKVKTNAMRVLERAGIPFQIREYELDEEHFSAERVAALVGMAPETVFKTLIAHGDKTGYLFALIPAGTELDLRSLAAVSGNKRVELAPLRDVLDLTGYVRGAVTPLAAKRAYPVFVDETVELWPQVALSGGQRGLQLVLAPSDLIELSPHSSPTSHERRQTKKEKLMPSNANSLMQAVKADDVAQVRRLIAQDVDVNAADAGRRCAADHGCLPGTYRDHSPVARVRRGRDRSRSRHEGHRSTCRSLCRSH